MGARSRWKRPFEFPVLYSQTVTLVFFARFGQVGELFEVRRKRHFGNAAYGQESTNAILATVG